MPSWAKDPKIGNRILCNSQAVAGEVRFRSPRSAGEWSRRCRCAPRATAIESTERPAVGPRPYGQGTGTAGEPLRESEQLRVVRAVRGAMV
ncbi:hypothetical protein [Kribbella sp. NBC_01484]|uniref:hypothetical protein n=1 Tax=Kribbella sp. NBC_01484 TaxID=2903579 RepID=UPI003FA5CD0F